MEPATACPSSAAAASGSSVPARNKEFAAYAEQPDLRPPAASTPAIANEQNGGYARARGLVSTHSPCSGSSSSPAGTSPHSPAAGSSHSEVANRRARRSSLSAVEHAGRRPESRLGTFGISRAINWKRSKGSSLHVVLIR